MRRNYRNLFWMTYPLIVLLSKIIRYTILYKSTVETGIGHSFIKPMLKQNLEFMFLWDKETDGTTSIGSATNNAMFIFQKFNWFELSTYEEFEVGITIVFNVILIYVINTFIKRWHGIGLNEYFFLAFSVGVINIYTFVLSKEPVQMLYFLTLLFALKGNATEKKKWTMCIIALLAIIVLSRTYFVLMLAFALCIRWLFIPISKKFRGNFFLTFVSMIILAGVGYMCFLYLCQALRPDDFAELIRVRLREAEDTVTDIRAIIVSENIPIFAVNYVITIIRMLFPIELAIFGPKYFLFIIYQIMISTIAYKALRGYSVNLASKRIATCIFWGYVLCSATFEPDFGSWIRHESATIPFMLFLLDNK